MSNRRTVMRFHGGKSRLAPWIIGHFPAHRVYVEPFGGAASVLLQKNRSYAEVYGDLDGEVCNVFRVLRDPKKAKRLEELLRLTPFAREEFEAAYLPCRRQVERARRTIIKAMMGFGSAAVTQVYPTSPGAGFKATTGFRSNSNRSGTTPAHDWANYPDFIDSFRDRLQGVVIENRDARSVIERHDGPETLVYADPPYLHSTRQLTKVRVPQAYRFEMSEEEHIELLEFLKTVRGMVVLSGYESPIYTDRLEGWKCFKKDAFADGARGRVECLWLNPLSASKSQGTLIEVAN